MGKIRGRLNGINRIHIWHGGCNIESASHEVNETDNVATARG
jgi:hypothetical protein